MESEAIALRNLGRDQAFVLALDAQYGEGKSWFLSRFRRQLENNHPVAFIDAWVDDANHEPLVSIMAAIEDGMQSLLKKSSVKTKLGALTRAALPIIGKAAISAGGKWVSRYLGDELGDIAKAEVSSAEAREKSDTSLDKAVNAASDGISAMVDNVGAAMLAQYRARQSSRETFKSNLRELSKSIDALNGSITSPIYIIIDELDRCRPSYAIALLEEIKHLFDVPGIIFIIALHGQQLTHSINAVYGDQFDSRAYLRRFFTRNYGLRRLSIKELVVSHFAAIEMKDVKFGAPHVWESGRYVKLPYPVLAGHLLTEWSATPREAQSVIDALRLFVANWDKKVPIELPLVLILILDMVRNVDAFPRLDKPSHGIEVNFAVASASETQGRPRKTLSSEFFEPYNNAMTQALTNYARNRQSTGVQGYISEVLCDEFAVLYGNAVPVDALPPLPSWGEYRNRVLSLGQFIERETDEAG